MSIILEFTAYGVFSLMADIVGQYPFDRRPTDYGHGKGSARFRRRGRHSRF